MYSYEQADAKREARLKEGRGAGIGADYLAWLSFRDFRSRGDESRKVEGRHGRDILTLSNVEARTFFVLDSNPDVVEIYDQYALDREKTRLIAKDLGIKHPKCPRSGADLDMTTDFLADVRTPAGIVQLPIQCKFSANLADFNTAEHMEIERRYWLDQGKKLRIATESPACIPENVYMNAKRLQQHRFLHKKVVTDQEMSFAERTELVMARVQSASNGGSLNDLAKQLALHTSRGIEAFTQLISNLIYWGTLVCDLRQPDLISQEVLTVKRLTEQRAKRLRRQA